MPRTTLGPRPPKPAPLPGAIDVAAVRNRTGLTQAEFSARFGLSRKTLQNWEQGIRRPDATGLLLLLLIDEHPNIVRSVVERRRRMHRKED
jgi:putative transcriptional regulator